MIVFVHGVPETEALWGRLRAVIGRPSVALSLPGFGCARPAGFAATKDDYVDWLRGELDGIDEPIDLVGHDWGAGFTYRIATARPEGLRSWAADVANIMHPDYVWHDFAQRWQTPGEGEAFIAAQNSMPSADRAALFVGMGVPEDDARTMAERSDETMGQCILDLYRSATPNPHASWGDGFGPTDAPGLVIHPVSDPFGDDAMAGEVARTLGARFERLNAGHWWPVEAPDAAAKLLDAFWSSLN